MKRNPEAITRRYFQRREYLHWVAAGGLHQTQLSRPIPAEAFKGSIVWAVVVAEATLRPAERAFRRAFRRAK